MGCTFSRIEKEESLPQRNSNSIFATDRSACCPAGYTAGTHASYTAFSPTSLTNRHIACLCYGSPQLQTTNKNFGLVFFRTQQGMF